ncbi:MAG: CD1871A family CXXC motif-containing protein [Eubacteriales bacterium]|nr:CD1871A family CXXC motif-containing protein [Eubacteriales bacterium]
MKIGLFISRLILGLLAVGFVVYGIYSGQAGLVLNKAIRICLECVGIG